MAKQVKDDASTLPDKLPIWIARMIIMAAYLFILYLIIVCPLEKQQGITNVLIVLSMFLYITQKNENKKPKETEDESPVCKYRRTEDYTKGRSGENSRDWGYFTGGSGREDIQGTNKDT